VECKADGFPKPQVTWKRAAGKYLQSQLYLFIICLINNLSFFDVCILYAPNTNCLFYLAGDTPGDYTDLKLSNPDISVEDGTLSINNIQKTNEGYYLCEAVNGIGSGLSAVILISVQGISHFIVLHFIVISIALYTIFLQYLSLFSSSTI